MKNSFFFATSIFILLTNTYLQATTKECNISIIVQNEKEKYKIGDTITVLIKVELEGEICDDAGEATKVFCKGLKILEQSDWKKISESTVGQKVTLSVIKSKDASTLTIYRKTGHYNCFRQREFEIVVPDD